MKLSFLRIFMVFISFFLQCNIALFAQEAVHLSLLTPPIPSFKQDRFLEVKKVQAQSFDPKRWRQKDAQRCLAKGIKRFGSGVSHAQSVKNGVCGISQPLRVDRLNGINFKGDARFSCPIVETTKGWLSRSVQPQAQTILGSKLVGIRVAASYACRTRNHKKGARISEHAFANAIDISEFYLADGRVVSVEKGWRKGAKSKEGRFLRTVFKSACGPFLTAIGPDGDRYHYNHFHFDLSRRGKRGKSKWCR